MFSKWIISLTKIILYFQYFRFLCICNLFPILFFFLKKMSCFYPPFLKFIENIFYSLIENCYRKVLNVRLNLDFRQTFFQSWVTCCFINSIKTADGNFLCCAVPSTLLTSSLSGLSAVTMALWDVLLVWAREENQESVHPWPREPWQ